MIRVILSAMVGYVVIVVGVLGVMLAGRIGQRATTSEPSHTT